MPADFHIDANRGFVFSKAIGLLSRADVLDHMGRLSQHPDFRPNFNQLLDFREVTAIALSSDDIWELAQQKIFSPSARRAFVVCSDLHFGLGRMFGAYRELGGERGIRIFRDMKTALDWLSLPAEPDPKLFARLRSASPNT